MSESDELVQLNEEWTCSAKDFANINSCDSIMENLRETLLAQDVSNIECRNEFSPYAPAIEVTEVSGQNFLSRWWKNDKFENIHLITAEYSMLFNCDNKSE